jgi:hypothetical protein
MLHQDVLMSDIDVDQWRNAQALLLRSAKTCRRLVVIHERGRVLKFRHTTLGDRVSGRVATVDDPHRTARVLYDANSGEVDFVVVMERDALDSYFAQVQDSWDIDEDLDEFVRKSYAALDSFTDGIVTYPGRARETLGLQWRLGASFSEVESAVREFVRPASTVILGVESDVQLWMSLILDFDEDYKITSVTTADPSRVDVRGTAQALEERLKDWVEASGKVVSLALVLQYTAAVDFLAAPSDKKGAVLSTLLRNGKGSLYLAGVQSHLQLGSLPGFTPHQSAAPGDTHRVVT